MAVGQDMEEVFIDGNHQKTDVKRFIEVRDMCVQETTDGNNDTKQQN